MVSGAGGNRGAHRRRHQAGCDALVAKPILQEALVNTVKGMLSAAA